jgi:hypothetical protein
VLSVFRVTGSDFHFGNPRLTVIIYKWIYHLIKISIVINTIYLNIIYIKKKQLTKNKT